MALLGSGSPALEELRARLQATARQEQTITYSELVAGVTFHIDSVRDGRPFQIDIHSWQDLDRAIIGDFLGRLAQDSYLSDGFMASALAVSVATQAPSRSFFKWAKEIHLLKEDTESGRIVFWMEQLKQAHAKYGRGESDSINPMQPPSGDGD